MSAFVTNQGIGGVGGAGLKGGGGGGSLDNAGVAGDSGGGAGGAAWSSALGSAYLSNLMRFTGCGAGGGGGGANTGGTAGAGGNGGGCTIWLIKGNLTLGASSSINISGSDGKAFVSGSACDGGGGAAGNATFIVWGSITNNGVTLSKSAGIGGVGNACNGGAGGDGRILIYSLTKGTVVSSP